jgi:hypothetical protein
MTRRSLWKALLASPLAGLLALKAKAKGNRALPRCDDQPRIVGGTTIIRDGSILIRGAVIQGAYQFREFREVAIYNCTIVGHEIHKPLLDLSGCEVATVTNCYLVRPKGHRSDAIVCPLAAFYATNNIVDGGVSVRHEGGYAIMEDV